MVRKLVLMVVLLGFVFASGCTNPYVKKLKTYEMQLAEGRDRAFYAAMEMTKVERLDVEDQFAKQGLENALLISAFVRETGKTTEDIMASKVFSYDDIVQILKTRNEATEKRKADILSAYRAFFNKIDEEDTKIKAIQEGVKKAEEVRQETYTKIGETLGVALGTAGVVAAVQ